MAELSKAARDNRANQLNPNNAAYRLSRGEAKASFASSNPLPGKPKQSEHDHHSRHHMPRGARGFEGRP
jgi:hypothetical protein